MAKIIFDTTGPFRVYTLTGENLTPRSAKAQGLLLLLLRSRHYVRTRVWVQDKLWSDRAAEQGAQSLRQSLRQIRKAFGKHEDILGASKLNIWLDGTRIDIRHDAGLEFAEGLDVRDPEFEAWLTTARAETRDDSDTMVAPGLMKPPVSSIRAERIRIAMRRLPHADPAVEWLTQITLDHLARSLSDHFEVHLTGRETPAFGHGGRVCAIQGARPTSDTIGLQIALSDDTGRRLYRANHLVPAQAAMQASVGLGRVVNEVVDAVGQSLLKRPDHEVETADHFCRAAIHHMFKMRASASTEADNLLMAASDRSDRGLYCAWRAQLKIIQWVERHETDSQALIDEAGELATRALEREPTNSMVLSVVANTRSIVFGEHAEAYELAQRALELSPLNPMAWWASSAARMYLDDLDGAYRDAQKGRDLAKFTPHSFWWDQQLGYAALLLNDTESAQHLLTRTYAQAPEFRPAMRYMIGLLGARGQEERALRLSNRLAKLEPGFSIDRMVRDETYPVSFLRRAPGVDFSKLAHIV